MKKVIFFTLMLLIVSAIFAAKVGTLKGLLKPVMMRVSGDQVFVVEGTTILVYSLKDLRLIRKFGKEGDGPGELKPEPRFSILVLVYPDFVFAESMNKIVYFSKDGKFLKEKRKFPDIIRLTPLGENYVGQKIIGGDDNKLYSSICIFNSKMERVKELYRQKFFQQGFNFDLIADSINFWVSNNKVFIEESAKGFFIEVFDTHGEKLYQIEKKYEKVKVTSKHEKEIIDALKEEPQIKRFGGWDDLKNLFKFKIPDSFPAIQDILVVDQKIYIQTFKKQDNKKEFIIMDLKGKIVKKVYLPEIKIRYLTLQVGLGPKFYSIESNKYYYILENEEKEEWELHLEEIK